MTSKLETEGSPGIRPMGMWVGIPGRNYDTFESTEGRPSGKVMELREIWTMCGEEGRKDMQLEGLGASLQGGLREQGTHRVRDTNDVSRKQEILEGTWEGAVGNAE